MLRGLYSATAGMITQQRKHDTVTNNIANLNTPGFKQAEAVSRSFPEMLISLVNGGENGRSRTIGRINTGVMMEERLNIMRQGDLQETNHAGDFALVSDIQVFENVEGQPAALTFDESGKAINQEGRTVFQPQAYFTVLDESGQERYTRNGKMFVNPIGELRTTDGFRVVGQAGQPIIVDIPIEEVRVGGNGQLINALTGEQVQGPGGEPLAMLISQVDNPNLLIREGNGVFRLNNPENNPARPIDNLDDMFIYQGFIERSNVDPSQSMVDMMAATRAYEANQRVIQFYDRSMEKAVNEVGRV